MKKTVQLRDKWTEPRSGTAYDAGQFLEIDEALAEDLIKTGTAIYLTPVEAAEQSKQAILVEEKKRREEERDKALADIKVIGDRRESDPNGGFKSWGHFLHDVVHAGLPQAGPSNELAWWNKHSRAKGRAMSQKAALGTTTVEFDDSQGGYLVPEEMFSGLMQTTLESSIVRQRATFMPMATNRLAVNAVVDNDHSTNFFGGITIQRTGESEQKSKKKPTFRQIVLSLHKSIGLIPISDEMIEDSPQSMEPLMTGLFAQAISFQEDEDFLFGTGINQPLGCAVAGCTIAQGKEVGQAADTVVFENIVKMWSRLYPPSMGSAVWLCGNDVLPQLYTMGLAVGTGGGAVFMPAGGASQSPFATLMGRPLIPTEKCALLGDQGDIILADFSQYLVGGKSPGGNVKVSSSIHLWFDYDVTALRFVLRYDGQPWWNAALTPLKSQPTLSPFVVLAERT